MLRKLGFLLLVLPVHASAAFYCQVKIQNVLVYQDGSVNVLHSGRGDYTVICNLANARGGVSTTTCAVWTGMLLAIKKKGGTAQFYFDGTGDCSTIATYGDAPVPTYIGDVT